jgi:putative NIF3 family GTP cyclohydrolase 1 type 2
MGTKADPRGKAGIKRWLSLEKKKYEKLDGVQKEIFDKERLTNPYADSRIHYGDINTKVKTIVCGIEIEEPEIALLNNLQLTTNNKQLKPDLIITHHPIGKALAALDEVMHLQADLMAAHGVPINIAEGVMTDRIAQVSRSVSPINHMKVVNMAKFAKIPIMNLHTPTDNLVYDFLEKLFQKNKCETLSDIIDNLLKVPEYKEAAKNNAGPRIFAGNPENRAGKIVAFDITGGTEGAKEIYPELARAGVGTIIGMHMKDENREEAIKHHLNVVIAGHISSDSLGMNLFLDELEKKKINIIPLGGLIRVKRSKNR